jgi:hypothetical protein
MSPFDPQRTLACISYCSSEAVSAPIKVSA